MKNKSLLIGLLLTAAAALPAHAYQPETSSSQPGTSLSPVPVKVTAPKVFSREIGQVVTLRLTVSAEGKVEGVHYLGKRGPRYFLAQRVAHAVQDWEFAPARDASGKAVPATVDLPIRITAMKNS